MRISLQSIWTLALRNIKCYLRDKTAVFFSFLSPLIILMLYLLFLGDIQNQSLLAIFQQAGLSASSSHVSQFVASWLISGVMSVTAFNCNAWHLKFWFPTKQKMFKAIFMLHLLAG